MNGECLTSDKGKCTLLNKMSLLFSTVKLFRSHSLYPLGWISSFLGWRPASTVRSDQSGFLRRKLSLSLLSLWQLWPATLAVTGSEEDAQGCSSLRTLTLKGTARSKKRGRGTKNIAKTKDTSNNAQYNLHYIYVNAFHFHFLFPFSHSPSPSPSPSLLSPFHPDSCSSSYPSPSPSPSPSSSPPDSTFIHANCHMCHCWWHTFSLCLSLFVSFQL